jgi:hypothetical protein
MPSFASPHPRYQQSFLASVRELLGADENSRWTGLPVQESPTAEELADPAAFAA